MRTLYLKLSREPDLDWIRFFHEERESRVVIVRHGLWLEDDYIVFDCLLRNVKTHHLPDFGLSLAYANEKTRQLRRAKREESAQRRSDEASENVELDELRTLVRADAGCAAARPALANALAEAKTESEYMAATFAVIGLADCEIAAGETATARQQLESELATLATRKSDDRVLARVRAVLAKIKSH